MNIQKYEILLKVLETGNLTRAAEELNYTQSGISQTIISLEKEWGISLFQRDRSGAAPTSNVAFLLPLLQEVCQANRKVEEMVSELKGVHRGLIRFGCFTSLSSSWLPSVLKSFQTIYPAIEFDLWQGDYTEIEHWLIEGKIDLGFLKIPASKKLKQLYLGRDRILAILPPNHPLKDAPNIPLNVFTNEPFILLDEGPENEFLDIFHSRNIKPNTRFRVRDDHTILSMVENGIGISILHELVMRRTNYNVITKELEHPVFRDLCIAMTNTKNSTPAVKHFIEYLRESGNIGLSTDF